MTITQAREDLKSLQQKLTAYRHATAVIYYDGTTVAPSGAAANRAQTLSILSEEIYRLSTGEETIALLEFLEANGDALSARERRIVTLMLRDNREMKCIPMDEYVAHQRLLSEADSTWHHA